MANPGYELLGSASLLPGSTPLGPVHRYHPHYEEYVAGRWSEDVSPKEESPAKQASAEDPSPSGTTPETKVSPIPEAKPTGGPQVLTIEAQWPEFSTVSVALPLPAGYQASMQSGNLVSDLFPRSIWSITKSEAVEMKQSRRSSSK